jgi:hypothetical protein
LKKLKIIKLLLLLGLTPYLAIAQYTGGSGKGDARILQDLTPLDGIYFTGATNNNFATASNWNINAFPGTRQSAEIRSTGTQPVLSGSQTIAAGTTINILSGASLTITPAGMLTVNGTLNNSGTFTLQSDASGSASIGNSSGSITGTAIVQRFVPAIASPGPTNSYGRRWRFVGSPVQNATFEDWRGETHVTGAGTGTVVGTTNSNGFDATSTNNSSIFYYNESIITGNLNSGWTAPTNTNTAIATGRGYRMFIRGDRSSTAFLTSSLTPATSVTLDLRGTLNSGDITMPVTFTSSGNLADDGWNLLANPYPCEIDWNVIHDAGRTGSGPGYNGTDYANLQPDIWIYNPISNSYDTYNTLSDIGTGSLNSVNGGVIASGQSFWVKATAASPSLNLKEIHKTTTSATGLFKTTPNGAFHLTLIKDSFNTDEIAIKYMSASTILADAFDTRKIASSTSVAVWGNDSVDLSISCRPTTATNDTIKLNISGVTGTYQFRFNNSSQLGVMDYVTLIDTYDTIATDLLTQQNYSFQVDLNNPLTFGRNRFYIVVSSTNPLPVELMLFEVQKINENASLIWTTATEQNSSHFEPEWSIDNRNFVTIGRLKAAGNSNTSITYQFKHSELANHNYYRVKLVDQDGKFTYSPTRYLGKENVNQSRAINVWPIPSNDNVTIESLNGDGISEYVVYSTQGDQLQAKQLNGITSLSIDLTSLDIGVYILKIRTVSNQQTTHKIIKVKQ